MLDRGATTTWELFAGFDIMQEWWTRSWCHAWSAFPGYVLSAQVLGVRPLTPGYARTLIAPQLGDLQWAEGRVPTPHGVVEVHAEQTATRLLVNVTLPAGVIGEVRVPGHGAAPVVTGSPAEITHADGAYTITLPPSAHATISG